jgi:signal transduction histidine kinase/HPt (histidine-containing phosphotransfer) domain-containing protein/ActR/RegA family two-component response regulator
LVDINSSHIESFVHPVIMVDGALQMLASNAIFKQNKLLEQATDYVLKCIRPLVQGRQDRISFTCADSQFVATSLPMSNQKWIIKFSVAQSSKLAVRYQNTLSAIDQMSDAVIICDAKSRIDFVNKNFKLLAQSVTSNVIEGLPLIEFISHALQYIKLEKYAKSKVIIRFIRQKLTLQKSCHFNFQHADGHHFDYRDRVTDSGERIGLLIDETVIIELNTQLQKACDEALNLSEAKSNFMAAMSHEVKTPLNAIVGMLDLCIMDEELAQNENIIRTKRATAHLMRLLNDVLDFTKFDAEQVQLSPVNTDIRVLCEQILEDFAGQAHVKNTSFSLYVDPNISRQLYVDDLRLTQVLANLISNAIKFNTSAFPLLDLHVCQAEQNGHIIFSVTDNGIGIPFECQEAIFSGFEQADAKIHRQFGGSGLGLGICQKIVSLMNGHLSVKSQPLKGATFTFDIPVPFSEKSIFTNNFDKVSLSNKSIFTDDRSIYRTLCKYGVNLGFKVVLLENMPNSLAFNEYLLVTSKHISTLHVIHTYSKNQIAVLADHPSSRKMTDPLFIQQTPIKLDDIIAFIEDRLVANIAKVPSDNNNTKNQLLALVVEDNQELMYVLRKQFKALDIKTIFATTVDDAVIYFEQHQFDLVLSDFQLPDGMGSELVGHIRQLEKQQGRPKTTIFIVTADNTTSCRDSCFDAGADKVLIKPLTFNSLRDLVGSVSPNDNNQQQHQHIEALTEQDDEFYFDNFIVIQEPKEQSNFSIETLYQLVGIDSTEELRDFLQEYKKNLCTVKLAMKHAVESQNWQVLGSKAHSLKSSANIVGAQKLSSLCENLEQSCKDDISNQNISTIWLHISENIAQVMMNIDRELSNEV